MKENKGQIYCIRYGNGCTGVCLILIPFAALPLTIKRCYHYTHLAHAAAALIVTSTWGRASSHFTRGTCDRQGGKQAGAAHRDQPFATPCPVEIDNKDQPEISPDGCAEIRAACLMRTSTQLRDETRARTRWRPPQAGRLKGLVSSAVGREVPSTLW